MSVLFLVDGGLTTRDPRAPMANIPGALTVGGYVNGTYPAAEPGDTYANRGAAPPVFRSSVTTINPWWFILGFVLLAAVLVEKK